jgi:autotransporter-associated beta strand protein/uncharacterized repeat protein (TIGR03803 family)
LSGNNTTLLANQKDGAGCDLILSGAPNGNGAKLKLRIDLTKPIDVVSTLSSLTVSCDISGLGGFDKTGVGTLALSGVNTYSGNTTVSAGKLLVNSPGTLAAASAVTVNAGGTLGGSGTIGGPVMVAAGGVLSPGTSVGILALNSDLTLSGNLFVEVNKLLPQSNDVITVSGTLTNVGTGTATVTNLNPSLPLTAGDSFRLFNKPVLNGNALTIVSSGGEVWTNKLAMDGSIAVVSVTPTNIPATNPCIMPTQNFTTLHGFNGGSDGAYPRAGLILSGNTLYGTTSDLNDGGSGNGTVFKVSTDGTGFTNVYSFTGGSDGANPVAGLILSGNTLYGTAVRGGSSGLGTVFSLSLCTVNAPRLTIVPSGANVVLAWPTIAPGFTLQSAPTVTGTFTNIPGATSPYTNLNTGAQKLFRLTAQ